MNNRRLVDFNLVRMGLTIAAVTALSACVVAPAGYRPIATGPAPVMVSPDVVVSVAPPAPYVEVIPPRAYANQIWLPGFWAWQGGRHQWVGGRWEAPPRGHTNWTSHRWVQVPGRGWHFESGRWH
jgi:hypothetical protein